MDRRDRSLVQSAYGNISGSRLPALSKTHVDLMFRAFSDPVRLRVLHLAKAASCASATWLRSCACHNRPCRGTCLICGRPDSFVSGRTGHRNSYTLVPGRSTFHKRLLACLGSCFRDVPELQHGRREILFTLVSDCDRTGGPGAADGVANSRPHCREHLVPARQPRDP